MTDQNPTATGERQATASAEPRSQMSGRNSESPIRNPYLKVFGADIGAFEFELREGTITIGRSQDADVRLPNRSVSRAHARITRSEGQFALEDANSTSGTSVNGERIESHILKHGDTIKIATYTLQFFTHHALSVAEEAAARAKLLLRGEYSTVPSNTRVRFRTLDLGSPSVFESGETLMIGQGGLLIHTPTP
ncbi:MAG: FHA domain-containing protein, partial [Phycisphaerae bacterium]